MSFYAVNLFKDRGFRRVKCKKCGRFFWTLSNTEICGEPPCSEYSFIGNSPMKKKLGLHDMREEFLTFFEKKNHTRIARYPVVARWRDDIFFTIASISCFQPWVLNRTIEPPANPLVMSQPSIRFNDIDNVGKTGRHLTLFEMMAHHAFNTKENFIYFNDRTVELCHEFLQHLGVPEEEIVYMEAEWAGGGNSGPCIEVLVRGLEIATLVFMIYEDLPSGKKELDMQVVDTGYGLERFTWLSAASPSVYESIFGKVLKNLKDEAKIETNEKVLAEYSKLAGTMNVESNVELKELRKMVAKRIGISVEDLTKYVYPFENLYAICDHTRALMFMLNDGIIPSNVKGGYFARLLARRTLRSMKFLKLNFSLKEILNWQIESFKDSFPAFKENKDDILNIVSVEEKKYSETVEKGRRIVADLEKRRTDEGKRIANNDLITFYDTYGLTPEIVQEFSKSKIEIPDDFYIQVSKRHEKVEEESAHEEKIKVPKGISETKLGFYEDAKIKSFKAKIVGKVNDFIILDKTYFYGESGGQEGDYGKISGLEVIDTQKEGTIILHKIKAGIEGLKIGQEVDCEINWKRREQLMQHHTSAHIINGAARRVLGRHVFQAGSHKSEKLGRLDITHYESVSNEELKKIEELANKVVKGNRKIEIKFMPRDEAEKRFGFNIYQGGAVPGKIIRVVNIQDWDVEACGGTHFDNTSEVGDIKILQPKRIQDGVIRLEFKSGGASIERDKEVSFINEEIKKTRQVFITAQAEIVKATDKVALKKITKREEEELVGMTKVFSVPLQQLPKTIERFQKEWLMQRDKISSLEKQILNLGGEAGELAKGYEKVICVNSHEEAAELFEDWKQQRRDIEKLQNSLGKTVEEKLKKKVKEGFFRKGDVKVVNEIVSELEVKNLAQIAKSVTEKDSLIILGGVIGERAAIVVVSNSSISANEVALKISKKLGGGAHGDARLAVGGGSAKGIEKVFGDMENLF